MGFFHDKNGVERLEWLMIFDIVRPVKSACRFSCPPVTNLLIDCDAYNSIVLSGRALRIKCFRICFRAHIIDSAGSYDASLKIFEFPLVAEDYFSQRFGLPEI